MPLSVASDLENLADQVRFAHGRWGEHAILKDSEGNLVLFGTG